MFARYYLELPLPVGPIRSALLAAPQEWMPGLALDAEERGEAMIRGLDFGPVRKRVSIEVLEPVEFPSRTVLPMIWRAADEKALFPVFEADVEVAALGDDHSQVSISARYKPPLGGLGKAIDAVLLHRVAESTIKDFLDHVGAKLSSLAGGSAVVRP